MTDRIDILEARVQALTILVLSHITITDTWVEGIPEGVSERTCLFAEEQADSARDSGSHLLAMLLRDLIRELRSMSPGD